MPGSSSGSLLGWSDCGGRHFQAPTEAHTIVQAWGEEGTGATRVSSRRQRDRGIGVRVEEGTTRWDGSILQTSLPSEAFASHACVITPHPAQPHPPWKLSQHLIPAGRAPQGGLCNDSVPRPEGSIRVTSIQLWPPTSIKDPITETDHLFWRERAVYSWRANCSTYPLFCIQDCTTKHKGWRIGFEIVQYIWTCPKDWMLPGSLRTGNPF